MAYTPPAGNAANFVTGLGYYEPMFVRHAFKLPAGIYQADRGDAVEFVETSLYSYPASLGTDFVLPPTPPVLEYTADGAVTVDIVAAGVAEYVNIQIDASGAVVVDIAVEGSAGHGIAGSGVATIGVDASSDATHGIAGSESVSIPITVSGTGVVERYELVGEVRLQGVLVDRRVRAYRRDTGALVGDASTVSGRFRLHTGFVAREHYLVPIDQANDATDWLPPCANRVMSVLAQDA